MLTSPGIPMLFQGQEFLEGELVPRRRAARLGSKLRDSAASCKLYRDLIQLRRDFFSTTRGLKGSGLRIIHADDTSNMLAFQRWYDHGPNDDVVVVANLDANVRENYRIGMPEAGLWKLRFNSDASTYSKDFGDFDSFDITADEGAYDDLPCHADIDIAPYSLLIYSLDHPA